MNNKTVWIIVGVIVLALVVFFALQPKTQQTIPASTPAQEAREPEQGAMKETTVVLSEQNDSGETGTATLTEENGQVKIKVNLTGAPTTAQPAHIHVGSCPTPGEVKYPLTNVVDGTSETMLSITLDDLTGEMPLAVNVHMSPDDLKTYVACGDVKL